MQSRRKAQIKMSIRKMVLLACAAVATVAFAVPAAASAVEWTKETSPLTQNENAEFTGTAGFETPGVGGVECVVHVPVTLEPGSTGTVDDFEITTSTCEGFGIFADCELVDHELTGMPWIMHATVQEDGTRDVDITNIVIHNEFDPECEIQNVTLTFGSVTATPDKADPISHITLSGTGEAHALGLTLEAKVTGTLEAKPAGVFGIS